MKFTTADGREIVKQDIDFDFQFEYHLVDHCNLNCAGCVHSSPLVTEPVFRKPEDFERDVVQLFKVCKKGGIQLLGGEPLLHPQLLDFCEIAVKYFSTVMIITNGLLLDTLPQKTIDTINNLNISMRVSDYGIIPNIKQLLYTKFKNAIYFDKTAMCQQPWNFNANYDLETILYKDCHAGDGVTVMDIRDGYLYKCGHQCYSDYLLKYFNIDLPDYDRDGDRLDLSTMTQEEFLHFVNNPVQFCKYCAYSAGEGKPLPWEPSQRRRSEFIVD